MATDIEKAVKDARIAASLAALCVLLVGVLLMIDGQRNKWMAEKIGEVQRIFAEFQGLVMGYAGPGAAAAPPVGGGASDGSGAGGDGAAGVVADAVSGAGVDTPGGPAVVPVNGSRSGRAGLAGGPRGDGG